MHRSCDWKAANIARRMELLKKVCVLLDLIVCFFGEKTLSLEDRQLKENGLFLFSDDKVGVCKCLLMGANWNKAAEAGCEVDLKLLPSDFGTVST